MKQPSDGLTYPHLIRNSNARAVRHLALVVLLLLTGVGIAEAQTCRIKCCSSESCSSFREVFEYDYVSEKPTFPGGDSELLEFINHHRQYPREAYKRKIQGRVTCQFVVNTDGAISNLRIVRGVEETLNAEALRILAKMPNWCPGRHNGQPVPVRVIWAVPFRL